MKESTKLRKLLTGKNRRENIEQFERGLQERRRQMVIDFGEKYGISGGSVRMDDMGYPAQVGELSALLRLAFGDDHAREFAARELLRMMGVKA